MCRFSAAEIRTFWGDRMESMGIVLTPKDGYILVDCADLDIHAAGCTVKEALDSFCEDFQFAAEVYANGDERGLSRDALDLAEKLKPFVSFDGTSRPFDHTWGMYYDEFEDIPPEDAQRLGN